MGRARRSRRGTTVPRVEPADDGVKRICPACRSARAAAIFLATAGLGAAADLLTKERAFASLIAAPRRSAEVIPGFLNLTLDTNRGIVFGIGLPGWLVLVATVAAMAVVIFLFASSSARCWGLHVALGMVLGGSIGNVYDRLFSRVWFPAEQAPRVREVRDFIDVNLGFMRWPVFNVADMLLVVGVLLILLHMIRDRKRTD